MTILLVMAGFATLALTVIASITVLNAVTFPRLNRAPAPDAFPTVSVLIPARNEAGAIGATVGRLLTQDYPDFEVIVLDDNSSDNTRGEAEAAAAGDARLRVVQGRPLPEGWLGKNWACRQLAQVGRGEILVFTDADVIWRPGALARLIGEMQQRGADLQTVWPTQITESWGERLVVPLMALAVVGYLPLLAVHHLSWPVFAAAMGQCLAFRREAYRAVGGHTAVRDRIVEDVAFAKRTKALGLRLRVADGAGVIACRMYHDWPQVRDGFAKNVLAGHGGSIPFLLLSWAFHWTLWLLPWAWLIAGLVTPTPWWPWWPLGLVLLGVAVRALTAAVSRQRVGDALLVPLSTLLMALIAARAICWQLCHGGPRWRGRSLGPAQRHRAEGSNP